MIEWINNLDNIVSLNVDINTRRLDIMVAPIVVYVYLPFFLKLNITSAYEYLEKRFNFRSATIWQSGISVVSNRSGGNCAFFASNRSLHCKVINIYASILVMGSTGRGPWVSRADRIKFCRIVADHIESIDERDQVVKNSSPIFHPSENPLAFLASF